MYIYTYIYVWDTDVNMCTEFELSGWDKVIIFNFSIHSNIFGPQPSSSYTRSAFGDWFLCTAGGFHLVL